MLPIGAVKDNKWTSHNVHSGHKAEGTNLCCCFGSFFVLLRKYRQSVKNPAALHGGIVKFWN